MDGCDPLWGSQKWFGERNISALLTPQGSTSPIPLPPPAHPGPCSRLRGRHCFHLSGNDTGKKLRKKK